MGWSKQYSHKRPYTWVFCIENRGSKMLRYNVRYGVIDENDSQYLIQFNNRSAKWYNKERFADRPSGITKQINLQFEPPKKIITLANNTPQLEESKTLTHKLF